MHAVKFVDGTDDMLEGLGIPFGGPFNGQDLYGEHFSAKTDFAFDWFPDGRPTLFHHGLDSDTGTAVVGRVKSHEIKADLGVWTKVQLDKSSEYFSAIQDLVKQGKLFFSSGAMAHLVDVDRKSGEIKRWPWVELSLTPTPANLLATLDFATAEKHFKSAGLELPNSLATVTGLKPDQSSTSDTVIIQVEPQLSAEAALKAVSFERIREECAAMLNKQMAPASSEMGTMAEAGSYCHVYETYADHVIASVYQDGAERYYRVPFKLDGSGHVESMGKMMEVEQAYKPVRPARAAPTFPEFIQFLLDEHSGLDCEPVPVGLHAEATRALAASLGQRTKDLVERRHQEQRRLSDANQQRLAESISALRSATDELQALLDSDAPPPEGTKDRTAEMAALRRLRAQMVSLRVQAMTAS